MRVLLGWLCTVLCLIPHSNLPASKACKAVLSPHMPALQQAVPEEPAWRGHLPGREMFRAVYAGLSYHQKNSLRRPAVVFCKRAQLALSFDSLCIARLCNLLRMLTSAGGGQRLLGVPPLPRLLRGGLHRVLQLRPLPQGGELCLTWHVFLYPFQACNDA